MQKIAAVANLVSYYCIGLPVGTALMFAAKLRLIGNAFILFKLCMLLPTKINIVKLLFLRSYVKHFYLGLNKRLKHFFDIGDFYSRRDVFF